jgi:hypothetical protein
MTTIILSGTAVLQTCDSATTDAAGDVIAIIGGKPDCVYPAALGVTAVNSVTLPSPWPGNGYTYSGGIFVQKPPNPAQISVQQGLQAPLITASYNASLQRQAAKLAAKGKTAQATALYLKAAGVLS